MADGNEHSLPVPDWAKGESDIRNKMSEVVGGELSFEKHKLAPVTNYSTFFAEWMPREDTILVHLFPRNGEKDEWKEGHYIQRCRACRSELSEEVAKNRKPCPRCGHVGLVYIPGRAEDRAKVQFPNDSISLAKKASDEVWMGNVAVEMVPELGALVVQFQDVTVDANEMFEMMEKFFDAFDVALER